MEVSTSYIKGQEGERPVKNLFTDSLLATRMFSEALRVNQIEKFFNEFSQTFDLNSISWKINIETPISDKEYASLSIDFFDNRLVTQFQGETKSVKLSCALGIISDLAEIFASVESSLGIKRLTTTQGEFRNALEASASSSSEIKLIQGEFRNALEASSSSSSEIKLMVDGKELVAFYPLDHRVVFKRQSSVPLEMIQSCAHLYNEKYAQKICPLLGIKVGMKSLQKALHKIYIGRCLLGLCKSGFGQRFGEMGHKRELARIVSLINVPRSAFYSTPLA